MKNIRGEELELFRNMIKKHIQKNGGIYTCIIGPTSSVLNENNGKTSLYWNGDYELLDLDFLAYHAVTIIGWDDNYAVENFNSECRPSSKGAYIALNSWGSYWGENGIFYISYEDVLVESQMSGIIQAGPDAVYETITFQDMNLYNAMKEELGAKIAGYNNTAKNITLSEENIDSLYYLELEDKNIENLSGLQYFTNLGYLNLNNNTITDLSVVSELDNLYGLNISGNPINSLVGLNNLEALYADNCSLNNSKINGLSTAIGLKELSLKDNNITDVSCLSNMELWLLDLSGNSNIDLSTIPSVEWDLYLDNCNISDITSLSGIQVSALQISNNPISDISPILGRDLWSLDISYTNITDVSNLTNIFSLNLSGNDTIVRIIKFKSIRKLNLK